MPGGDTYKRSKIWVGVIIVYKDGGGVIYWLDVAMTELLLDLVEHARDFVGLK